LPPESGQIDGHHPDLRRATQPVHPRDAAREKGVDYELVPTRPGETAPINPLGKIPMMEHGDFTLYESPAIARYIDWTFDGPPLWPTDAKAEARGDDAGQSGLDHRIAEDHRFLAGETVTAADLFLGPIFSIFPKLRS
jgi:glutathione S-transferase